jgi:filamentous hemagglutinin
VGSTTSEQKSSYKSLGVTAGFGGALMEAAQSAYESGKRGSEVKDDRLKALYAAQAAYQAYDTVNLAKGAGSELSKDGVDGGINLQLGIGASNSRSDTRTYDEQAYGSHIRSQGNVTIAATGGDLNIVGSEVDGKNVALAAAHDINLLSQAEQHTDKSDSKSSSGGIGVQVGTDGIGIYAQVAVGKSNAHGNGTTHAETIINASDTLSLVSGNDTTIKGAQLKGDSVLANIGGNLLVESEQDTDDYASKQQQASGKVVIGYSSGASGSYSQGKMDSHYTSVNEVSGISAGQGGYAIYVGGDTHLKGGVIASDADPSKNYLSTGTLTYEDIKNEAHYSASSFGVSGGYGSSGGSFSGSGSIPQSESESSTTHSGIALGTIDVRSGPVDLSGLDRNPSLDNQALKGIFDEQKVRENQELGQVAGQVGMRTAGDVADYMREQAAKDLASAQANGDKIAEADAQDRLNHWSEGGSDKVLLHGLVGAGAAALGGGDALQGGLGALANQAALPAMAQYLVDHGYDPRSSEFASMLELGSATLGASVGGGAGAATALDGTKYNYLKHSELRQVKKDLQNCLTHSGDVSVCQGQVLVDAKLLSQANDITLYLDCTGVSGCKASDVGVATRYAVDPTVPDGLKEDQLRGTEVLLTSIFSNDDGYKFYPELSDREAFFQALQNGTESKGSQTVWPQVAAQTSSSLQTVNSPICPFCGSSSVWVNQVGTTIMKNEWPEFHSLYSGSPLTGAAAAQWDTNLLLQEQKMLQPMYEQLRSGGGWRQLIISVGGVINTGGYILNENTRNEYGQDRLDAIREDKGWTK